MNDFTKDLIERLRSITYDPVVASDELLSAEEVLRKFSYPSIESQIEELNEGSIELEDADAIQSELLRLLTLCSDSSPARPQILWALAKLQTKDLEPLFWTHLEKSMSLYRYAAHYLAQCVYALHDCGAVLPRVESAEGPVFDAANLIRQAELALIGRHLKELDNRRSKQA
ncbi:MAG: hypothetical protein JNM99_10425 [Verrucomicrobiaceae bacterium]|nr:hypothetical protein [Verrucomicrobiaceae bacterium]